MKSWKLTQEDLKSNPKLKEQRRQEEKLTKKLRKKVKKYDTIGALWFDEKDKEQEYIRDSKIFSYYENLFNKKDKHSGNKYFFQLMLMVKIADLEKQIKELKAKR